MTAETNHQDSSPMEPEHDNSDEVQSADVIDLFPPELDALQPNELSDSDCIDLFASIWLHPSVTDIQLAERIANDTVRSNDPWHQRLNVIRDQSPFIDYYDEAMKDPVFADIVDFLMKTKNDRERYEYERTAAKVLSEFCITALIESESTEKIGRVFAKIPRQ